jgi:hypothetical protein
MIKWRSEVLNLAVPNDGGITMEEKKKIENIENLDPEDLKDVNGGAILFDAYVAVKGVRKGKDKTNHAAGDDSGKKKGSAGDDGVDQIVKRLNRFAGRK